MIGDEQLSFHSKTRKVAGEMTFTNIKTGKKQIFASAQCVHCNMHWQVMPGSGKMRGYCFACKGMLCGAGGCLQECVPFEARLELWEGNVKTILKYKNSQFFKTIQAEANKRKAQEQFIIKKLEKQFGKKISI